ncbi:hypothetical protein N7457_000627 [Penicillium paradoxum]|uniref:uncharacterized protein n=1 Tax=Penicillium paradoxum TaxID=176176 RepID=UPI002548B71D|nr:uncharacterized protein N7457_000627 [Penicillium paradoxum]KAJ5794028.1 hypothetical protein N7457_000627 [Penicillium paradoxum]
MNSGLLYMVSLEQQNFLNDTAMDNNGFFPAFSQEDSMATGNGLGFNITRRIILSLGGNIQVNSEKDVGTEFVTTVNLSHASELPNGIYPRQVE